MKFRCRVTKNRIATLKALVGAFLLAALSGCVSDGEVCEVRKSYYETGIMEREGLALARIVTSPYSIVGFTYADCKRMGNYWPLVLPFDLLRTVPAGTFAACADILTGTTEFLTFHQFKSVSYPWESFDKAKADKWGDPILEIYLAALAGGAEGLANASTSSSSSYTYTSSSQPANNGNSASHKVKPRVSHSWCHGSGRCQSCNGRGTINTKPRMRCRTCGGSGNCPGCHGRGYAN